jgi:hypothetical protein
MTSLIAGSGNSPLATRWSTSKPECRKIISSGKTPIFFSLGVS